MRVCRKTLSDKRVSTGRQTPCAKDRLSAYFPQRRNRIRHVVNEIMRKVMRQKIRRSPCFRCKKCIITKNFKPGTLFIWLLWRLERSPTTAKAFIIAFPKPNKQRLSITEGSWTTPPFCRRYDRQAREEFLCRLHRIPRRRLFPKTYGPHVMFSENGRKCDTSIRRKQGNR